MPSLLFLCTGNYYRSRFAEMLFNDVAVRRGLDWRASSAGLRVDPESPHNPGPLSPHAHAALMARGIALPPLPAIPKDHPLALVPLPEMGNASPAVGNGKLAMGDPLPLRFPRQVTAADLVGADLVIALKEAEHRPLMKALHPEYAEKVTYWHIHDLDCAGPGEALGELETELNALIRKLADGTRDHEPSALEKKLLDQSFAEYEQDRDPGIPWRQALRDAGHDHRREL